MKFQNVIILFTAAVSATGPPTCKGSSPSYCKYTSNRDATECKRFFAKSYINVATCQLPAKTVTSTSTKCVTVPEDRKELQSIRY
ncbi:Ff.00g067860.m01.CDS01 [Fusarium sp. VM40]|nr:Ff.00g067860.m01.CDS01 [Fusarium sp. VM40]